MINKKRAGLASGKLYEYETPYDVVMVEKPLPTAQEVWDVTLSTLRHSCQVEYYLHVLELGKNDPQRPHDITGMWNKFSWEVMRGLAVQYRPQTEYEPEEYFRLFVLPSIELHRTQHHHRMWNAHNPDATEDDLLVGALDALCSRLDDRPYQGGAMTFDELVEAISENEPWRVGYLHRVRAMMMQHPKPPIDRITTLRRFPNVGLPVPTYIEVQQITSETLRRIQRTYPQLTAQGVINSQDQGVRRALRVLRPYS